MGISLKVARGRIANAMSDKKYTACKQDKMPI